MLAAEDEDEKSAIEDREDHAGSSLEVGGNTPRIRTCLNNPTTVVAQVNGDRAGDAGVDGRHGPSMLGWMQTALTWQSGSG